VLNPDFAVLDIEVQNATKISLCPSPAYIQQLIVITLIIKQRLHLILWPTPLLCGSLRSLG
jgi:hypothetical protein